MTTCDSDVFAGLMQIDWRRNGITVERDKIGLVVETIDDAAVEMIADGDDIKLLLCGATVYWYVGFAVASVD